MGAVCTNQPIQLPDYKETVSGTQLPSFVAAGGKELYEQARELSKSPFPQFQGERIATYGTDDAGNPLRMSETERSGLQRLATGAETFEDILSDATEMAGNLGGGFKAGTFTPTATKNIVGESFEAPTFDETFTFGDFDADRAGQYQDVFQTSIDPAIDELNRQRDLRQRQNSADAIRAGAFGGSRLGIREALTDSEIAKAGSDLRKQTGREALQFASQRFDTDRMFDANRFDTDRRNFEADRAFDAGRFDADRQSRFAGEAERRAGFETGEASRLRGFETDEASKLRATETLSALAPLAQGLNEQVASGMITAGQAERELDQRALDLAYNDFLQQQQFPFEMLNFALGALQGIPYETLTRQQATGNQFMQQPSIYGQTLGGLGTLASLYALSSRRA
tara:strand:+ start:3451 stop:4641 length:1191 start_codon:yes stop_codon:yes gene_type:complete